MTTIEYLTGLNLNNLALHYKNIVKEATGEEPKKSPDLTAMARGVKDWFVNPKKPWLWLGGSGGTGKSTMLEAVERVVKDDAYRVCYRSSARDFFSRKHNSEYYHELMEEKTQREMATDWAVILLDDVGTEKRIGNDYGDVNAPFADFIDLRYNRRRDGKNTINIIASNLTPTELLDRYGERTVERIKEMCQIVNCGNKSFR